MLWGLLACVTPAPDWQDQVQPGGPCYDANLLDGLDESSTLELHDTFACLNVEGAFDPLSDLVAAMDASTRDGTAAGIELARTVNRLDLVALLELLPTLRGLLDSGDALVEALQLSLEALYGQPWSQIEAGQVELASAEALDDGLVVPLMQAFPSAVGALLTGDALPLAADLLENEGLVAAVYTLSGWTEGRYASVVQNAPARLAGVVLDTRSPDNDIWTGASGDSLRDLADALLLTQVDGEPAVVSLVAPARGILGDAGARVALRIALAELADDGHLTPLPQQMLVLADQDVDGGALARGEDSSLVVLLRLLHDANGPMRCSIDLGVTDVGVEVDNLAVALLETLAAQDPTTVDGGVALMGDLLGASVPKWALEQAAKSGVCDVFDEQMAQDLEALDRLTDPETGDLLLSMLALLAALESRDRVPELVDLLAVTYDAGAVHPIQELFRDVGDSTFAVDLMKTIPGLDEPSTALSSMPAGLSPTDLDDLLLALEWSVTPTDSGQTPIGILAEPAGALLEDDGAWIAMAHLAELLSHPSARLPGLIDRLPELLPEAPDPERWRAPLASGLRDPQVTGPLLRIAETRAVLDAATAPGEAPLPFLAELVVGGTLSQILLLLQNGLAMLRD